MEEQQGSLYGELAECCLEVQIDKQSDTELLASAVFLFSKSYIGFKGHFPGQPVLPAIVQLAMVRYLAERCLGRQLQLKSCNRTKFRSMIQPNTKIAVNLDLNRGQGGWGGSFTLKGADGETVASGGSQFSKEVLQGE